MSFDAICPECDKSLRLRDELDGKKVKCPKCGNRFTARAGADLDADDDEYAMEDDRPGRAKQRSKRRDDDDDEDDDERPRKKKRKRDLEQVTTPIEPIIWAILSLMCPCGCIGIIIASIAITKARTALGDLPSGRRADSARRNLNIAAGVGIFGLVVSILLSVVGVILKILDRF